MADDPAAANSELSNAVIARLYSARPDQFIELRARLAAEAKAAGSTSAAARIGALRKPSVAAWIVNRLVHQNPDTTGRLADLGDRLRGAQEALDTERLRELSTERRRLVDELNRAAFAAAERNTAPSTLRDEVVGTLEAAIADPDVAGRLGRLHRAERWSGFGFVPTGAPELTLVRGGRDANASGRSVEERTNSRPASAPSPARREPDTATPRGREPATRSTAVVNARRELAVADEKLTAAETNLTDHLARIDQGGTEVTEAQRRLDRATRALEDAKGQLAQARRQLTVARAARRTAQARLDRAERANR